MANATEEKAPKAKGKAAKENKEATGDTEATEETSRPKLTPEEKAEKLKVYQKTRWQNRDEKQKEYDRDYRKQRAARLAEEAKENKVLVVAYEAKFGALPLEEAQEIYNKIQADEKAEKARIAAEKAEAKKAEKAAAKAAEEVAE